MASPYCVTVAGTGTGTASRIRFMDRQLMIADIDIMSTSLNICKLTRLWLILDEKWNSFLEKKTHLIVM